MIADCRSCGRPIASAKVRRDPEARRRYATSAGRGLCTWCHLKHTEDDTLLDYERVTRTLTERVEDYEFLRCQGYTRHQIAERMGITYVHLDNVIQRGRRSGQITMPKAVS